MSLEIFVTDEATDDAIRIADELAERADFNTSDRFLDATMRTYRRLADLPGMGVGRTYRNPRLAEMLMFPLSGFPKYLVFYRATDTALTILRVLHGAQDIEQIFSDPEG